MKTKFILAFIGSYLLLTACSADDGKDGQQGPQGPAGTANIMYSNWINQNWNMDDASTFKQMRVTDSHITDAFLAEGGVVLGFFRFQENVPFALPHQDFTNKNIRESYPVHFASNGEMRFVIQSTDGTALTTAEVNGSGTGINPQYKYILIPGGVNITGKKASDLSKMSYHDICKAFNIPE